MEEVINKPYSRVTIELKDNYNINEIKELLSNRGDTEINLVIKNISKKNKCKYKVNYIANGDAFLTKPGKTIHMSRKIIKKITRINPKFSTTGGTSDARFIRKISPCLEFGMDGASTFSYTHLTLPTKRIV